MAVVFVGQLGIGRSHHRAQPSVKGVALPLPPPAVVGRCWRVDSQGIVSSKVGMQTFNSPSEMQVVEFATRVCSRESTDVWKRESYPPSLHPSAMLLLKQNGILGNSAKVSTTARCHMEKKAIIERSLHVTIIERSLHVTDTAAAAA